MKLREILKHTPRLGDNPNLMQQPSLDEIVQHHYRMLFGTEQGAIIADMYLQRLHDFANAGSDAETTTADSPIEHRGPAAPASEGIVYQSIPTDQRDRYVTNVVRLANIRKQRSIPLAHIVDAIEQNIGSGRVGEEQAELLRPIVHGGIVGDRDEIEAMVVAIIDRGDMIVPGVSTGYVASTRPAPRTAGAESVRPAASSDDRRDTPDEEIRASAEPAKPAIDLASVAKAIDLNVKVGSFDLLSGIERANRGDPMPLMAGVAGILMGAIANAGNRSDPNKKE